MSERGKILRREREGGKGETLPSPEAAFYFHVPSGLFKVYVGSYFSGQDELRLGLRAAAVSRWQ
jgi:hypothetical protein